MSICPTCGTDIDPLRAPVARIVGGKITTFCSPACAAGKPAAAAPSPAAKPAPAPAATPAPRLPPAMIVDDVDARDDEPQHVPDLKRRRNRRVFWLTAGIIAGGMAVVVIQTVSPSTPGPVSAQGEGTGEIAAERPAPAAEPAPGPATLDVASPAAVRDYAIAELRALVAAAPADRTSRISREAARALSRTGDPAALELLARSLDREPSEIARLEAAYALARGGDARGRDALVKALRSTRRDVRSDAARMLVLLGDQRGAPALENMMEISQHRLSAAEALAPLGDAQALKVLKAVRKDPKASHEDKLRALVALGRAGKADVAAELRAVLGDGEFNVGAAEALARIGDAAAAPVLAEQLAVPSLQVGAALGLRRLDPDLDPTPYLPGLVAAMTSGKDTAKVTAAEAVLVLTGPAEHAERD